MRVGGREAVLGTEGEGMVMQGCCLARCGGWDHVGGGGDMGMYPLQLCVVRVGSVEAVPYQESVGLL